MDEARRLYGEREELELCSTRDDTLDGADGLIVITEWNEFRSPDFQDIRGRLSEPAIFDGRNLYDPDYLRQLGFDYYGIGREKVLAD
jgi:UDPglucose 6-dehydrogenase